MADRLWTVPTTPPVVKAAPPVVTPVVITVPETEAVSLVAAVKEWKKGTDGFQVEVPSQSKKDKKHKGEK
ncbi:MAG: hypothetical protein WCO84_10085 [bacterium]